MISANSGNVRAAAGYRHHLPVGDRERDDDNGERHEDDRRNDLAE
jgi:hypothetical protein